MKEGGDRLFMSVIFHNKGMGMIGISKILNSRRLMAALPRHLRGPTPMLAILTPKQ